MTSDAASAQQLSFFLVTEKVQYQSRTVPFQRPIFLIFETGLDRKPEPSFSNLVVPWRNSLGWSLSFEMCRRTRAAYFQRPHDVLTLRFGPLGDATSPPQACSKGAHPKSLFFFWDPENPWGSLLVSSQRGLFGETGSKLYKFQWLLKASLYGSIKLRAHQVYEVHEFSIHYDFRGEHSHSLSFVNH